MFWNIKNQYAKNGTWLFQDIKNSHNTTFPEIAFLAEVTFKKSKKWNYLFCFSYFLFFFCYFFGKKSIKWGGGGGGNVLNLIIFLYSPLYFALDFWIPSIHLENSGFEI